MGAVPNSQEEAMNVAMETLNWEELTNGASGHSDSDTPCHLTRRCSQRQLALLLARLSLVGYERFQNTRIFPMPERKRDLDVRVTWIIRRAILYILAKYHLYARIKVN